MPNPNKEEYERIKKSMNGSYVHSTKGARPDPVPPPVPGQPAYLNVNYHTSVGRKRPEGSAGDSHFPLPIEEVRQTDCRERMQYMTTGKAQQLPCWKFKPKVNNSALKLTNPHQINRTEVVRHGMRDGLYSSVVSTKDQSH